MQPFADPDAAVPVVVGHRGAPLLARENTPAAFAAAAAVGATWVELDARRSADGALVVHHDPVTADGIAVVGQSSARLAEGGVHELGAVLDGLPGGLGVDIEVKNLAGQPDYDEDDQAAVWVCDLLAARLGTRLFMTSSFNPLTVAVLAATLPQVPAGLLHGDGLALPAATEVAVEQGARVVCPHVNAPGLDEAGVRAAHGADLAVLVWTVDDPGRARTLASHGVDAICTNDPAGIVAALGTAG